jgi:hypothetical protein
MKDDANSWLDNCGLDGLAKKRREESIEEMRMPKDLSIASFFWGKGLQKRGFGGTLLMRIRAAARELEL